MTGTGADTTPLFRTPTGRKLHIPPCPHPTAPLEPATQQDLDSLELCTWCTRELNGEGRQPYASLEDAMTAQGILDDRRQKITKLVAALAYDDVYIPNSAAYIGLANKDKRRTLAWVHKAAIDVVGEERVWFPGFEGSVGGTGIRKPEPKWGTTCDVGHTRSVSGRCYCDED